MTRLNHRLATLVLLGLVGLNVVGVPARADGEAGGAITVVAGNGQRGYFGEGGPAIYAHLAWPSDVALAPDGSLYIADMRNHRVCRVDAAGTITTVAGNGSRGYSGDGGPATAASLHDPVAVAMGRDSSLYIADSGNERIRKVDGKGIITTVAGNGCCVGFHVRFKGDGGPATEARLHAPKDVAVGPDGSLYIADVGNHRIRKVDPEGIITTIAGSGQPGLRGGGSSGDGGPATEALLYAPGGLALGTDGTVYIADTENQRVRTIDPKGVITTIAGDGKRGYAGDGGPAAKARLWFPRRLAVTMDGSLYIADGGNRRIRRIGRDGVITTVVGNGGDERSPDGLPATQASIGTPGGIAVGPDGGLYITEADNNNRVRRVRPDGIMVTVAGSGSASLDNIGRYGGDGGAASQANLDRPTGLRVTADGALYVADFGNHRIRKVSPAGIITTVAGDGWTDPKSGAGRFAGDGGPATAASLNAPTGVAVGADGAVYVADSGNHRIRKVDARGTISTVAGDGYQDQDGGGRYQGDGGPAVQASLNSPGDVALAPDGSLYVADRGNHRIRKIGTDGVITTVAGDGWHDKYGDGRFRGDGGPATKASLNEPGSLAFDADGNLYFVDRENFRVRKVDAEGIITTVAGTGEVGSSGDGGPATRAGLAWPAYVAVSADGTLYVTDGDPYTSIRRVSRDGTISTMLGEFLYDPPSTIHPEIEGCLESPLGVAVGPDDCLYVAESGNHRIVKVSRGAPPF
jgi:sugar lactone lactonase YvrE